MEKEKRFSYKELQLKILKMNPGQKRILALKGNISERKILIRDSNLDVQIAVLTSPKCTEGEVEKIAALASTHDRVLKHIYSTGRWAKSQRIKLACLKNPKLPMQICRKFLSSLHKHHVTKILKDPTMPKKTKELAQIIVKRR